MRGKRSFALIELAAAIALGLILSAALAGVIVNGIYVSRLALSRTTRSICVDSMVRQLHVDAIAARSCAWGWVGDEYALELRTTVEDEPASVAWRFGHDLIRRIADGAVTGEWRQDRLNYDPRVGDEPLLELAIVEAPPPRRALASPRVTTVVIPLPTKRTPFAFAEDDE